MSKEENNPEQSRRILSRAQFTPSVDFNLYCCDTGFMDDEVNLGSQAPNLATPNHINNSEISTQKKFRLISVRSVISIFSTLILTIIFTIILRFIPAQRDMSIRLDDPSLSFIFSSVLAVIVLIRLLITTIKNRVGLTSIMFSLDMTLLFVVIQNAIVFLLFYLLIFSLHLSFSKIFQFYITSKLQEPILLYSFIGITFVVLNSNLFASREFAKKTFYFILSGFLLSTLATILFIAFIFLIGVYYLVLPSNMSQPESAGAGFGLLLFPLAIGQISPFVYAFFSVSFPFMLGSLLVKNRSIRGFTLYTSAIFVVCLILQARVLFGVSFALASEVKAKIEAESVRNSLLKYPVVLPTYLPPYISVSGTRDNYDDHLVFFHCNYPGAYEMGESITESTVVTGGLTGNEEFLQRGSLAPKNDNYMKYPVTINGESGFIMARSPTSRYYSMFWTYQGRLFALHQIHDICFYSLEQSRSLESPNYSEKDKKIIPELIKIAESMK